MATIRNRVQFNQMPCDDTAALYYGNRIYVRHPSYEDIENTLFDLLCTDGSADSLYHALVHTAAAIIAGNRFDGFLSRSRDSSDRVTEALHELLPHGDYYFHLPTCTTSPETSPYKHDYSQPYPIFASFSDWLYPHSKFPPAWKDCPQNPPPPTVRTYPITQKTAVITNRDECCRLTGAIEYCEAAHLIAIKHESWFGRNDMFRYAETREMAVHDHGNILLLRSDLHKLYDAFKWVIFPKATNVGPGPTDLKTQLVFHLMEKSPQLGRLCHNVPLREVRGLRPEYLLAGFAMAIFNRLGPFFHYEVDRYIIVVDAGNKQGISQLFGGFGLAQQFPLTGVRTPSQSPTKRGSRTGSQSPSKRPRTKRQAPSEDVLDVQNSSLAQDNMTDQNSRKRRRSSSDPTHTKHMTPAASSNHQTKRLRPSEAPPTTTTAWGNNPCTCPTFPPTPHSSSSSPSNLNSHDNSPSSSSPQSGFFVPHRREFCASSQCCTLAERNRLEDLREDGLAKERAKSGTEEWWRGMEAWYRVVMEKKGGLSPRSVRRMFWVQGMEVGEDEGKEGVEGIGEGGLDFLVGE